MNRQTSLSIKIIYWVTEISFWIYTVAALFAVGMAIVMMLGLLRHMELHVGLPVTMNAHEVTELVLQNETVKVEMKELMGKIHFIETPVSLARIYGAFMLVVSLMFYYVFFIFRKFIHNVRRGQFFERSNIALLQRISYAILVFWVFTLFYSIFQYFFLARRLSFESLEFNLNVQLFSPVLLAALFIWVLSHIFMKGAELQEENELTV